MGKTETKKKIWRHSSSYYRKYKTYLATTRTNNQLNNPVVLSNIHTPQQSAPELVVETSSSEIHDVFTNLVN